MRIAIFYPNAKGAQKWRDAVAVQLRDAQVDIWQPGVDWSADYAIGWAPSPEFFASQTRLRAFFTTGAGVEHVIHNPKLPPDLPIVRVEDAGMGPQMVDYCRYEVLHWMQRRDEYTSQQSAGVWKQRSLSTRDEWPIGVFGLGVLGRQVASAFAADGFPVKPYSRSASGGEPNVKLFSASQGADQFQAFMHATRVLAILAPLTAETQDKFDLEALRMLPAGAYVINIARGGLIVDEALLELLDSGHLAGAALDVFRKEPLPAEHRYWNHPKVRITPHVAAITPIGPASKQIIEKIQRLARNEPVTGIIDRARGY
jgi:glyoxylate/hydroxypyruvate reductase A